MFYLVAVDRYGGYVRYTGSLADMEMLFEAFITSERLNYVQYGGAIDGFIKTYLREDVSAFGTLDYPVVKPEDMMGDERI